MKLTKVRVTNYKCIDDSEEFSIRQLTCLAGKNEAGKSALLQALRRLNPVEEVEANFDKLIEYPRRHLNDLKKGGDASCVIDTEWELEEGDLAAIEETFGPQAVDSTLRIRRGYDNETAWCPYLNEKATIQHLLSQGEELTESTRKRLEACETVEQLRSTLNGQEQPQQAERLMLDHLNAVIPTTINDAIRNKLEDHLPKFLYFPAYSTLQGQMSLDQLKKTQHDPNHQEEHGRVFAALLGLAGVDIDDIANPARYEEQKAQLESISNNVSDEIFKYWSQNRHLEVEFDLHSGRTGDPPPFNTGEVIDLRVRNTRHRVSVPFDERSTGFVWFFSFLVYFSQMRDLFGDNLIVLLDEPGLTLHGKAQGDLLRYIKERLLPRFQVVYTTHSPFMIDPGDLAGVRTVEDAPDESEGDTVVGTKVRENSVAADSDTLLPLRAALGYELTQSLFIGENSLLVEGASDLLFLQWASRRSKAAGGTGLDSRWTVTPVGGITKIASFASLFGSNLLKLAVLVDLHHSDKKKVTALEKAEYLNSDVVFSAAMFVEQGEADIEDMLGRDLYVRLVNRAYGLKKERKFDPDGSCGTLLAKAAADHFRTVATDGPFFDHLTPAVHLVEHESVFSDGEDVDQALTRFNRFFARVNALLPPGE